MSEVKCNKIKNKYVFKCGNSNCNKYKTTRSIRSERFFLDNFNINFKDVLKIMSKFSQAIQCVDVLNEIHCCKNNLSKLFSTFRRLCRKYYENNCFLLGGDEHIINCDE